MLVGHALASCLCSASDHRTSIVPGELQEEVAAIARQEMSAYSIQGPAQTDSSSSSSRGSQVRLLEDPEVSPAERQTMGFVPLHNLLANLWTSKCRRMPLFWQPVTCVCTSPRLKGLGRLIGLRCDFKAAAAAHTFEGMSTMIPT